MLIRTSRKVIDRERPVRLDLVGGLNIVPW